MPVSAAAPRNSLDLPDPRDLDDTWRYVSTGLDGILSISEAGMSRAKYIGLVTAIQNLCSYSVHDRISARSASGDVDAPLAIDARLYAALTTYIRDHLRQICNAAMSMSGSTLLTYYAREWDRFTQSAVIMDHVFNYLNRHYVMAERERSDKQVSKVAILALLQWRDVVVRGLAAESRFTSQLTGLLARERNGEVIDAFTVKKVIQSLITIDREYSEVSRPDISLYGELFFIPFLRDTREFYVMESTDFLSRYQNDVMGYVSKATNRLAQEESRANFYLHHSDSKSYMATCREALVGTHVVLLQQEVMRQLELYDKGNLKTLYNLLSQVVDGVEPLKNGFCEHVHKEGMAAMAALVSGSRDVDPFAFVEAAMHVHERFLSLVEVSLEGNKSFMACVDKAFMSFVNHNPVAAQSSKSAELVAKFADNVLKRGSKASSAIDVDVALTRAATIFEYLQDKDIFQKFYTKFLARRLIHSTSISHDAEVHMISRLRIACGNEYTAGMQKMMQDIAISQDLNTAFQQHSLHARQDEKTLTFTALLLSSNIWPLTPAKTTFHCPLALRKYEEQFKLFYMAKFSGRKIEWLHHHSRNDLRLTYTTPNYTINASTYQAGILLQFNESDSMTYDDIANGTGLSMELLQPHLELLVKQKILLREDATTFELNRNYRSPKIRVNINVPLKAEATGDNQQILAQTAEGRKIEIQLVLVRIMKARKTLPLSQLVTEAIEQLSKRFIPKVNDIKVQIDWLIDHEYLERGESRTILKYLA